MFVLAQTTFPHDRFLHPNFSQLFRAGPKIQSISSKEFIYHLALLFDPPMPLTASFGHLVPFPVADSTFAVIPAFWFLLGRHFSIFHPSDDSNLGELSLPPTPLPPKHIHCHAWDVRAPVLESAPGASLSSYHPGYHPSDIPKFHRSSAIPGFYLGIRYRIPNLT